MKLNLSRIMEKVTIVLHKEEMLGDVVATAHVVGRRVKTVENEELVAEAQAPEEGVDRDIVARAMSVALGRLKVSCARYMGTGLTLDSNVLGGMEGDWRLVLDVPKEWNFAAMEELTLRMHGSVVDFCVYSIFEKTLPNEAMAYLEKSVAECGEVKRLLELRTGPVRRRGQLY